MGRLKEIILIKGMLAVTIFLLRGSGLDLPLGPADNHSPPQALLLLSC